MGNGIDRSVGHGAPPPKKGSLGNLFGNDRRKTKPAQARVLPQHTNTITAVMWTTTATTSAHPCPSLCQFVKQGGKKNDSFDSSFSRLFRFFLWLSQSKKRKRARARDVRALPSPEALPERATLTKVTNIARKVNTQSPENEQRRTQRCTATSARSACPTNRKSNRPESSEPPASPRPLSEWFATLMVRDREVAPSLFKRVFFMKFWTLFTPHFLCLYGGVTQWSKFFDAQRCTAFLSDTGERYSLHTFFGPPNAWRLRAGNWGCI